MAITQAVSNSFKTELFEGLHDFQTTGNAFNLALHTSAATMSKTTTVYVTANEVPQATGYTTKGNVLTKVSPVLSGDTALIDFADSTWSTSTITANGGQCFNDTAALDESVFILAFGGDKSSSNGDFTVKFPVADATNAILRIA